MCDWELECWLTSCSSICREGGREGGPGEKGWEGERKS